ncbi:MAG: lipoprotein-releasing system transmembrane subunit LolC [Rhodobacterales bacterium]|nr:MAG: lipoprotein-releasing system transmembrane subunit LolC [Rhodobacterales bacterium]
MSTPAPFSRHERMIAWRYVRARRAEGGVSVMTWISLIGVTLAVFALIAVMSVRSGFRSDFVDTIVGANPHVTLHQVVEETRVIEGFEVKTRTTGFTDYLDAAARAAAVPGVVRAAPVVRAQILASRGGANAFVDVHGIALDDLRNVPGVAQSEITRGSLDRFDEGIAIGEGVANSLGVLVGDRVRLISPEGVSTAAGQSYRTGTQEVVYIFRTGRWDIDQSRVYMPLSEAQSFFSREGKADQIEIMIDDPENAQAMAPLIASATGGRVFARTWQDYVGAFLRALTVEDNMMFIIMAILVLIASMNIISGLIMLVKNKGRDIGILRTMGLTEGSVLRIFFICGAGIGTLGTVLGVILGCLFAIYIDQIFSFVNWAMGGGVWDPSIRGIYAVPAELRLADVLKAVVLSLSLSWIVTIFPARRAARMNPVEALRYE